MEWSSARRVAFVLSLLLLALAGALALPAIMSAVYREEALRAFVLSIIVAAGVGLIGMLVFRSGRRELTRRQAFAVVALGWVVVSLVGALPFLFAGVVPGYLDAWFECVSGFTTTGSTVIADVEALPKGILLWRSLTQWLGGMGIIVLAMALLPALGVGGMQLYAAEMPGPTPDRLRPRIRDTAKTLWLVYVGITAFEMLFLVFGPMDWFDSLCHSLTTMATGGYSTRNASIGAYGSAYVEWVVTGFMVLAGTNFALHYYALTGRPLRYLKDPEFRFYAGSILAVSAGLIVLLSLTTAGSIVTNVRQSVFQVVSIMTTTGYASTDYELWPIDGQLVLLALMFVGGCAGSTAGSIKCLRIQLLLKRGHREMYRLLHPRAVAPIRHGEKSVTPDVLEGIAGYIIMYLLVFSLAVFAVGATGLNMDTALSSVAATLGNVGPGLADVGPLETYALLPGVVKVILSVCMLLGRLELYALLLLFMASYWRR